MLGAPQAKHNEPVAVPMFDLDQFKSIKDRFDHTAGDEVLRLFGRVVWAGTRADGIIARFGGEEVIAIVPVSLERAQPRSPNACARASRRPARSSPRTQSVPRSVSAPVSREPVTTIDGLIALPDATLYRAKHPVRNRVHIAEEDSANNRTRMIAAVRRARQVGQRAAQYRCLRKSASAAG